MFKSPREYRLADGLQEAYRNTIKKKEEVNKMNGCERIKCPFYKYSETNGHECTDKDEYVSKIDGELICRFNKDAIEKYNINNLRQSAIAVIDAWVNRYPMADVMERLSQAVKYKIEGANNEDE